MLEYLSGQDMDWFLNEAETRNFESEDCLIEDGIPLSFFAIVTAGLFSVRQKVSEMPEYVEIDRIGIGGLIGFASIIEETPSSVRIVSLESSSTLSLPRAYLEARLEEDARFAARFYRSVALQTTARLKAVLSRFAAPKESDSQVELFAACDNLKSAVAEIDGAFRKSGKESPEFEVKLFESFNRVHAVARDLLGETSNLDARRKSELGSRFHREMLPLVLLTGLAQRIYAKPRGYAGDSQTIELLYDNLPKGSEYIGRLIDKCFLNDPAAIAVRNRRELVKEQILQRVNESPEMVLVTSLACGPARELFDVFDALTEKRKLQCSLIDFDPEALRSVAERSMQVGISEHLSLLKKNLIHAILGREKISLPPQDFVYSIGLIDYFDDNLVIRLLNQIHTWLKPGGSVMLGNFHPRNPSRALMEHVLDWKLIHRTERDMARLFLQSTFSREYTSVHFEPEGINLFAICTS